MHVRLLDPETDADVTATGGPGVPAGKGPTLCLGYWDDAGRQRAAVHRRRLDADGRPRDDRRRRLPHGGRAHLRRDHSRRQERERRAGGGRSELAPGGGVVRGGRDARRDVRRARVRVRGAARRLPGAHPRRAARAPRRGAAPARSSGPSASWCSTSCRARPAASSPRAPSPPWPASPDVANRSISWRGWRRSSARERAGRRRPTTVYGMSCLDD